MSIKRIGERAGENSHVVRAVEEFAVPLIEDFGCDLVEIQFRRESRGWVLRFYIDKPGGITIDDCATVSREISAVLEVEDPVGYAYHLEVSSPGLERPLTRMEDFDRFRGRRARIKLREPLDDRRVFIGVLDGLDGDYVHLLMDDHSVRLATENIARARLVLEL